MRQKNLVPTFFALGNILFTIQKVFAIIGAVVALIGILSLSFLPSGSVKVDTSSLMKMKFDLSYLGEGWEVYREALKESVELSEEEGEIVIEEDGSLSLNASLQTETLENRGMALSLIPSFTQLLIQIFFYHFLAKICKSIKESVLTPFTKEIPEYLRNLSYTLFALAIVPSLAGSLITLVTKLSFESGIEFDLETALWGLLLLGLAEVFRFGSTLPTPAFNANAPEEKHENENSNNPDAF